ncbi:Uncharacterized protein dnm_095090 [Desulfonema magnum]|uniref:Uncharacterized protein n=1 Tax=Desulfonema magnum TaxID=45655 RepID=A0A975BX46_9BACT|nr:hypothetical protein [Desulfonema magnum]QTA93409.1 Uncharacterized protein dnm_095090 [Desulfonema magnum]
MALIPVRWTLCGGEKVKKEERQMRESSVTCVRMRIARQNPFGGVLKLDLSRYFLN